MPKMKKVVALRDGLKDGYRKAGDVFEVHEDSKSKWYRDLEPAKETKGADKNADGKLSKEEILKWFEENELDVDASLGVTKLREAYAEAVKEKESNSGAGQDSNGSADQNT